jgi:hypothetical protein
MRASVIRLIALTVGVVFALAVPSAGFAQAPPTGKGGLGQGAVQLRPAPADQLFLRRSAAGAPGVAVGQGGVPTAAPAAFGLSPALVSRVPAPLLLPTGIGVPPRIALVPPADPDAYAATFETQGQNLLLIGSVKAYVPPPGAAPAAPDPGDPFLEIALQLSWRFFHNGAAPPPGVLPRDIHVIKTEYGTDVSFTQFGAPYTLSLVCDAGAEDDRCSQSAAMLTIAQLVLVGGGAKWF